MSIAPPPVASHSPVILRLLVFPRVASIRSRHLFGHVICPPLTGPSHVYCSDHPGPSTLVAGLCSPFSRARCPGADPLSQSAARRDQESSQWRGTRRSMATAKGRDHASCSFSALAWVSCVCHCGALIVSIASLCEYSVVLSSSLHIWPGYHLLDGNGFG